MPWYRRQAPPPTHPQNARFTGMNASRYHFSLLNTSQTAPVTPSTASPTTTQVSTSQPLCPMVRAGGFEPPRLSTLVPRTSVSAVPPRPRACSDATGPVRWVERWGCPTMTAAPCAPDLAPAGHGGGRRGRPTPSPPARSSGRSCVDAQGDVVAFTARRALFVADGARPKVGGRRLRRASSCGAGPTPASPSTCSSRAAG